MHRSTHPPARVVITMSKTAAVRPPARASCQATNRAGILTRSAILATMVTLQAGCSVLMAPPAAPTAEEIPSLQADLEREPGSLPIRLRLAEAYRLHGQA